MRTLTIIFLAALFLGCEKEEFEPEINKSDWLRLMIWTESRNFGSLVSFEILSETGKVYHFDRAWGMQHLHIDNVGDMVLEKHEQIEKITINFAGKWDDDIYFAFCSFPYDIEMVVNNSQEHLAKYITFKELGYYPKPNGNVDAAASVEFCTKTKQMSIKHGDKYIEVRKGDIHPFLQ